MGTSPVSWFPQVLRDLQHSEDDWGVPCCTGKSLRSDEEELESGLMRHASSRKQGTYVSIVRAEYPLGIEPVSRLLLMRKPLQFVYTTYYATSASFQRYQSVESTTTAPQLHTNAMPEGCDGAETTRHGSIKLVAVEDELPTVVRQQKTFHGFKTPVPACIA